LTISIEKGYDKSRNKSRSESEEFAMRRIHVLVFLVVLSILFFCSCSDPIPISAELPEGIITTKNVQYNGWKSLVAGGQYVFSADGLGFQGTGKINTVTNRVTEVCLKPNCDHSAPYDPKVNPDYCRMHTLCDLYFVAGQEIFYSYHVFDVDYDKVDNEESNNTNVIYIFASYNFTTGESRDILKIKTTDFEQMYNFIHHDGYIYYNRNVAKTQRPKSKEDYALSLCRMKIGAYKEEVLFAFENGTDFPDPLAVSGSKVYFTCTASGRVLEIDVKSKKSRYLLGGSEGVLGFFDSNGVFYVDNFIYFTAISPDHIGTEFERSHLELYRVHCTSGKTEKLTEDFVNWFFVSDKKIYYETAPDVSFAEEKARSVRTVKETDHDGKNARSFEMLLSSPDLLVDDVVGAGDCLYFRMKYRIGHSDESAVDGFKISFHLKDSSVTEFGKKQN